MDADVGDTWRIGHSLHFILFLSLRLLIVQFALRNVNLKLSMTGFEWKRLVCQLCLNHCARMLNMLAPHAW